MSDVFFNYMKNSPAFCNTPRGNKKIDFVLGMSCALVSSEVMVINLLLLLCAVIFFSGIATKSEKIDPRHERLDEYVKFQKLIYRLEFSYFGVPDLIKKRQKR